MEQQNSQTQAESPKAAAEPSPLVVREATISLGMNLLDPVEVDADAQKALERAGVYRDTLLKIALRQTSVSQWCAFKGDGENAKTTYYPMGAAAAAMFSFFGMHWSHPGPADEQYASEIYTDEEGGRWWVVRSKLWRGSQFVCHAEGKRKIGSGYAKNELDARMDAFENLQSRAARAVFGLGSKSAEDFLALGLNMAAVRSATFADHKSSLSNDPTQATIPFGKSKGQKVADASDDDLKWLLPKIQESVADPAKAKYRKSNEALATAIAAEIEARAAKPTVSAEEADEFEKTVLQVREEAEAQGVNKEKFEKWIGTVDTLAKAKKALENYRAKRKAADEATP